MGVSVAVHSCFDLTEVATADAAKYLGLLFGRVCMYGHYGTTVASDRLHFKLQKHSLAAYALP